MTECWNKIQNEKKKNRVAQSDSEEHSLVDLREIRDTCQFKMLDHENI